MSLFQIIILAMVQGVTEFLPVSSSAHLILVPWLTGWADQGILFDVAVHFGTLLAVLWYFREDLRGLFHGAIRAVSEKQCNASSKLLCLLALATLPAVLFGIGLYPLIEHAARSPRIIAFMTVLFALVLYACDRFGRRLNTVEDLGWRHAVLIGVAQALALIPGTSRSGVTMSAALALGYTRKAAARLSFLLSIPVIGGALLFLLLQVKRAAITPDWLALITGALVAGACALACIHYFLRFVERVGMTPFVIYRLVLGAILFALFF